MHDEFPKVTDIRTRVRRPAAPASRAVAGEPIAPVLEPVAPALEPIATAEPTAGPPTAAPPTAVAAMNTSRASITSAGGLLTASVEEMRAAFGLLTRLRIGPPDGAAVDRSGAAAFPIVGAFVAVIAMVPLVLAGVLEPLLASLLSLAMIAVVTGALHLDGLADTADALLARDHGQAERARKDPAVGPGGAVALILVLGVEASSLAAIVSSAGVLVAAGALLVAAVVGRTTPILVIAAGAPERATGRLWGLVRGSCQTACGDRGDADRGRVRHLRCRCDGISRRRDRGHRRTRGGRLVRRLHRHDATTA